MEKTGEQVFETVDTLISKGQNPLGVLGRFFVTEFLDFNVGKAKDCVPACIQVLPVLLHSSPEVNTNEVFVD